MQLKAAFVETEAQSKEVLYQTWKESTEENKFSASYRELFMQLEEALGEAMKGERSDKHAKSERGWTPPPKGYSDVVEKLQAEKGSGD